MPKTYPRQSPVTYATRRAALEGRVRGGETVEAVARELCIPRSTARLWAAQGKFRLTDMEADAEGRAAPEAGEWARPDRRRRMKDRARARAEAETGEETLPPADYPELRGLSGRRRLETIGRLASAAQLRAIAAIEEGCIGLALGALREAQRLNRIWRVLQDWQEQYPDLDEPAGTPEPGDWRAEVAAMRARAEAEERGEALPPEPEPEPAPRAPTAEDRMRDEVWAAVQEAREAEMAQNGPMEDEAWVMTQIEDAQLVAQILRARAKWLALPGRTPPPVRVVLPPRRV